MIESNMAVRVGKLERDFSRFANFIRVSLKDMGKKIDKGNAEMGTKIDDLFENIGKNNQQLEEIRTWKKVMGIILKGTYGAIKHALGIIISIVTLYFLFKHGGKIL